MKEKIYIYEYDFIVYQIHHKVKKWQVFKINFPSHIYISEDFLYIQYLLNLCNARRKLILLIVIRNWLKHIDMPPWVFHIPAYIYIYICILNRCIKSINNEYYHVFLRLMKGRWREINFHLLSACPWHWFSELNTFNRDDL